MLCIVTDRRKFCYRSMLYTCNTSAIPSFAQAAKHFRTHPDRYDAMIMIRDNIKETKM